MFTSVFACIKGLVSRSHIFGRSSLSQSRSDDFLPQDLSQRVLHCLFLDLSDFRYHIPNELPIDRFLATGVPPGTRNDGKTDTVIRYYQRELERRMVGPEKRERSEQGVMLGRLLRRRELEVRRKEGLTRSVSLIYFSAIGEGDQNISCPLVIVEQKYSYVCK